MDKCGAVSPESVTPLSTVGHFDKTIKNFSRTHSKLFTTGYYDVVGKSATIRCFGAACSCFAIYQLMVSSTENSNVNSNS